MKTVYLTGFMGSGKTTVGKLLAAELSLPAYDNDLLIEQKIGKRINNIFADHGEQYFRMQECEMLQSLPTENAVVMTGGGVILNEDNRIWMNEHGITIYLQCDIEEVKNRLKSDTTRPLLSGKRMEQIDDIFRKRKSYYEEAHIHIDVTKKDPQEVVSLIKSRLK